VNESQSFTIDAQMVRNAARIYLINHPRSNTAPLLLHPDDEVVINHIESIFEGLRSMETQIPNLEYHQATEGEEMASG
jgi:hypothetical protein